MAVWFSITSAEFELFMAVYGQLYTICSFYKSMNMHTENWILEECIL